MSTQTFDVSGMTCDHCVNAVRSEIERIDGVTDVDVELESGRVTVSSDGEIDPLAIRAAVDEAGYEVVS